MIVYIDGVFDLFHRGHLESLKKSKFIDENVTLLVGIISDEDATSYKRKPIINFEDRIEIIKSIKYVDRVIEKCPLIITESFINENKIDLILHGFSNVEDEYKQNDFFKDAKKLGKFKKIDYYDKTSTTDIISKIIESKNLLNN